MEGRGLGQVRGMHPLVILESISTNDWGKRAVYRHSNTLFYFSMHSRTLKKKRPKREISRRKKVRKNRGKEEKLQIPQSEFSYYSSYTPHAKKCCFLRRGKNSPATKNGDAVKTHKPQRVVNLPPFFAHVQTRICLFSRQIFPSIFYLHEFGSIELHLSLEKKIENYFYIMVEHCTYVIISRQNDRENEWTGYAFFRCRILLLFFSIYFTQQNLHQTKRCEGTESLLPTMK